MSASDSSRQLVLYTLATAIVGIFLLLVFRNSGLGPSVLGDEWSYSLYSRLLPLSKAQIPSFLYFLTYRSSNLCGADFMGCVRVLNAGFFVAAAPFLFMLARRYMQPVLALVLTLASLLGPVSTYTAFFMPEAMYFFLFWVFAWLVLAVATPTSSRSGLLVGALLGIMCLVKLHAVFLLAGYVGYLLMVLALTRGHRSFRATLLCIFATVTAFFVARLILGYFIAGRQGLDLLGGFYAAQANSNFRHPDLGSVLHYGIRSLWGHGMALVLLYAVPLTCVFKLRRIPAGIDDPLSGDRQRLLIFGIAVLSALVAATVYFTANVPDGNPVQALRRLHMRYYDFALPLLYLIAGAWTRAEVTPSRYRALRHVLSVLFIGGLYAFATYHHLGGYAPNRIDAPEVYGLVVNRHFFHVLSAMGLGIMALWAMSEQLGTNLYVWLFVPVLALGSSHYVASETAQRRNPDTYDTAGQVVRAMLPLQRSGVVVFGDDIFKLAQTEFQLDAADTSIVSLQPGQAVAASDLPPGKQWVVVIGVHPLHVPAASVQHFAGFSLYRLQTPFHIDFSRDSADLTAAQGLSGIESFGRWSDADDVVLQFDRPLPPSATLQFIAAAYGPNVGKPFSMTVGSETQDFTLGDVKKTVTLRFHNPPGTTSLRIRVPAATSPMQLGRSSDPRRLGIALSSLDVNATHKPH